MEFTAQQIAQMIGGRVEGDENARVNSFAKIEEGRAGAISFLANEKYTNFIYDTQSSVVLIDENLTLEREVKTTLIRVKNAYDAVARLLQAYESMKPTKKGIDSLAFIAASATVGEDCYVGAFAYIGEGAKIGKNCQIYPHAVVGENVSVGDDCIIYPNAVVYHDCRIGSRVTLHAGSVVGADGFGFAPTSEGYDKIPQIGIVTIEDDVEIGANSCIDRSTMGSTYVRKGVKIDNLVQIAHNTDIGANTVMSAQVGVAGSTKIGEWCMFGGQVGIAGHITIGNRVNLGAQSGAPSS
ncbi:MAG: UDP-3-O-(3-hydroxymyristoyl)glucosamine N-acyltransferase, partial [Prevotella sp.]|nr:UDP-3-O-(3-hydroxymyristoyl)glucosamine N-acyltransferase [Prevotella sp.]